MPGYVQEFHQQPRSREIERIFQNNKADIKADLESLDLSLRDIGAKYKVNDRNVRRWAEKLGIDCAERSAKRRKAGLASVLPRNCKQKGNIHDDKPQAHKLAGLW